MSRDGSRVSAPVSPHEVARPRCRVPERRSWPVGRAVRCRRFERGRVPCPVRRRGRSHDRPAAGAEERAQRTRGCPVPAAASQRGSPPQRTSCPAARLKACPVPGTTQQSSARTKPAKPVRVGVQSTSDRESQAPPSSIIPDSVHQPVRDTIPEPVDEWIRQPARGRVGRRCLDPVAERIQARTRHSTRQPMVDRLTEPLSQRVPDRIGLWVS